MDCPIAINTPAAGCCMPPLKSGTRGGFCIRSNSNNLVIGIAGRRAMVCDAIPFHCVRSAAIILLTGWFTLSQPAQRRDMPPWAQRIPAPTAQQQSPAAPTKASRPGRGLLIIQQAAP